MVRAPRPRPHSRAASTVFLSLTSDPGERFLLPFPSSEFRLLVLLSLALLFFSLSFSVFKTAWYLYVRSLSVIIDPLASTFRE